MSVENNKSEYHETFFVVPAQILNIPGLTLGYLKVYETIYQFWNKRLNCFLSNQRIATRTNLEIRQVMYALDFFEKNNELKRIIKGTKRFLIQPELSVETDCADINQGCTPVQGGVHSSALEGCTPVHHNIKNINKEKEIKDLVDLKKSTTNKIKDFERDTRFMRFYNGYPKREKPADAWKAFKSIVGNNDELLEKILIDLELRKKKHSKWQNIQFIELPASYLRSQSYRGEIINDEDNLNKKTEQKRFENEQKALEQERQSQLRAEQLRKDNELKYTDGAAQRKIKSIISPQTSQMIKNIRNGLEMK